DAGEHRRTIADAPVVGQVGGGCDAGVRQLVDSGELIPVEVEGWQSGGRPARAWLHRDAARPRKVDAAALLTPFDPLVWFRDRAERLFRLDYRIEIYTPAAQRRFGYYSLPVLVGDDIVARVDLKSDRAESALRVQSAWWEPHAPIEAADRIAVELLTAARWQGLEHVTVSHWGDAADAIASALGAGRHEHPDGRSN
uniref:DNA glycosylase AlkZ-like family protein n=1 Tax=uncultured Microbacterium sp. TaxID=191216 RepID=UPI0025F76D7F